MTIEVKYKTSLDSTRLDFDKLPDDIKKLIKGVSINYLHPQEGKDLLRNAQEKLRSRLLANWGRTMNVTDKLRKLEEVWKDSSEVSNEYLSSSLTDELQKIWPKSKTSVVLPATIKDILTISEINFQGEMTLPEISLVVQGSGAQQIILYIIHYLLDSDRTLHKGEYHPVWLLEEPESFLHADLVSKLGSLLGSEKWLDNIQMIISTHSPIILAASRLAAEKVMWIQIEKHICKKHKKVPLWTDAEIYEIGNLMGDSNFFAYFIASNEGKSIFLEDSKSITIDKMRNSGINVTRGLNGTSEVKNYINVYTASNFFVPHGAYFIVDADKGMKQFASILIPANEEKNIKGFKRYKAANNVFIILLPDKMAIEDLFNEYDSFLEECIELIYDTSSWALKLSTPTYLSAAVSAVRGKPILSFDDAKEFLKNHQDIKSQFWNKVESDNLDFATSNINAIKKLIE